MGTKLDWRGATLVTLLILGSPVLLVGFLVGFLFELGRVGFRLNSEMFGYLAEDPEELADFISREFDEVLANSPDYESWKAALESDPEFMRD